MKKLIKLLLVVTGALAIAASAVAKSNNNSEIQQSTKIIPQTEKNKTHAVEFYDLMFNQNKPREAVERYVGSEYIQHNPHVADGKEAFIEYFEKMAAEYPEKRTKFIKIIAEGNLVVLHCYQHWPRNQDYAGIDIFRFDEDGKIVEHWDVLQVIPDASKNNNGMF